MGELFPSSLFCSFDSSNSPFGLCLKKYSFLAHCSFQPKEITLHYLLHALNHSADHELNEAYVISSSQFKEAVRELLVLADGTLLSAKQEEQYIFWSLQQKQMFFTSLFRGCRTKVD